MIIWLHFETSLEWNGDFQSEFEKQLKILVREVEVLKGYLKHNYESKK
jgi:hypothetical protein